jgi:hypothetical protein
MSEKTARLTAARHMLEAALGRAAAELTALGDTAPLEEIARLAGHMTTLQSCVEALERAIAVGERYKPTYFGD